MRMKVIWICHFSTPEVRERLPLTKTGQSEADYALWIPNLVNEFRSFKDIDVHIIAPHTGLKALTHSFEMDGFHYYFYKADVPFIDRVWPTRYRLSFLPNYWHDRLLVQRIIRKIKPDLINLMGSENPYYSSTVLGIKDIPILISIQGIYSNDEWLKQNLVKTDKLRYRIERYVNSQHKYFSIGARYMIDLIKRDVKEPILFWSRFPQKIDEIDLSAPPP